MASTTTAREAHPFPTAVQFLEGGASTSAIPASEPSALFPSHPGSRSPHLPHPLDPEPESPPFPPLLSASPSFPVKAGTAFVGPPPVPGDRKSLNGKYDYHNEYNHEHEHEQDHPHGRDRRRIERWLEQQCRFAPFEGEGESEDAGDEEKGRGDGVLADEETILPVLVEKCSVSGLGSALTLALEGAGGSRAGISTALDDGAEEVRSPLWFAHGPQRLSAAEEGEEEEGEGFNVDRADSPILGHAYACAPENRTSGDASRHAQEEEEAGGGRLGLEEGQDLNADTDPGPDPSRFPGLVRNFVREGPLGADPGLLANAMAGEEPTGDTIPTMMKTRDELLSALGDDTDKPLPPFPPLPELGSFSAPGATTLNPTNPEKVEGHPYAGINNTLTTIKPPAPTPASASATTASSTPESSFTVPSAVSAPSLGTPPPLPSHPIGFSFGFGVDIGVIPEGALVSPESGRDEVLSSFSALGLGLGLQSAAHEDSGEVSCDGPRAMTLSLSLPSPLSFGMGLTTESENPSLSPAWTSSTASGTSTFTAQQQQQPQQQPQQQQQEQEATIHTKEEEPNPQATHTQLKHPHLNLKEKKTHSPAPSYSSSYTSSSHTASSSSSARSVHSAQSHFAQSHFSHPRRLSRAVSGSGSVAGSLSGTRHSFVSAASASKPFLARSASTSSFVPGVGIGGGIGSGSERQRKVYLPLGPATASINTNSPSPPPPTVAAPTAAAYNHSRTSSSASWISSPGAGAGAGAQPVSMIPVVRPERKSSLANLRASMGMVSPAASSASALGGGASSSSSSSPTLSLSRRPSRALINAVLSESSEEVVGAEEAEEAEESRAEEVLQASPSASVSAFQVEIPIARHTALVVAEPHVHAPTATATATAAPAIGAGVGMYHLPTALLRASRSSSQLLLLDASNSHFQSHSNASSPVMAMTPTTPLVTSPLPPSAPPTRRQSRAALRESCYYTGGAATAQGQGQGHTPSLSVSSSAASSSRSRSRAGSIALNGFAHPGSGAHAPNLSIASMASMGGGNLSVNVASSHVSSSSSYVRHAVYIDSEEVRERLHKLLASAGDAGDELEFERPWVYAASEEEEGEEAEEVTEAIEGVIGEEEEGGEDEEAYGGLEEEPDRFFIAPAPARAVTTMTASPSGTGTHGTVGNNGIIIQGQAQQERWDAHTHAHAQHQVLPRGLGARSRTPSALNLNLTTTTMDMDVDTDATSSTTTHTSHTYTCSTPAAPTNTPATSVSFSAASTVPATPVSDSPSTSTCCGGAPSIATSPSTSTATYNAPSGSSTGLLYENPHASSSQVYIGPIQQGQPGQGQASSSSPSPSRSSGRGAAAGSASVHSRDTSRSSNSNSNSHSSSGHSRVHSHSHSQAPSLSRTLIHSRTSSQHSHSQSHSHSRAPSHSRTHSRAASKEKPVIVPMSMSMSSMPSMSPKQLIAQLPSAPSSAPPVTSTPVNSISIPVPLRLPPLPSPGRKPNRPPPAPPLDLGGVDVDMAASAVVPVVEVMMGDEHEERMRDMMLAVGPDADEQLGVDPVVSMASGGFVDVAAEMDGVEERMSFARGRGEDEEGDRYGYESGDDGFEVVTEMRRRPTRASVRAPVVPVEEVRRVSGAGEERVGEESGSEEEEITAEDIERMQFLRGLKLEDRLEMPDMPAPADLDKMLVEFPRAPVSPERARPRLSESSQPEVHFVEDDTLLAGTPPHGSGLGIPGPSMSRWSLTSSTMDDSPPAVDRKEKDKKERERKRKSFVSFGTGKEKEKESGNLSPGWSEGEFGGGKDKEKKRGRLASFISRLSNVGSAPMAISSSSSGSMISGSEDLPPPVPSVPALSLLLPSPQIIDGSKKKDKEKEALPPLPSDVPEPTTSQVYTLASPRSTPPSLRLDLSKTHSQTQKYVVERDDTDVAGSVKGVWGSSAASTSSGSTKSASAKASKSVPGSPIDAAHARAAMDARAAMGMPSFSFSRSAKSKPKRLTPSRSQTTVPLPLGKSSSDGLVGSRPSISISTFKSVKEAEPSQQLARERSNSTAGSNGSSLARRPTLVKSASASLLRQVPAPPTMARAGSAAAPGAPAAMHLQTYPPQPETQYHRAQYQNQHQHQVQYQYRAPLVAGVDGSVPPTPSSLASTDIEEEEDEEEEIDPEMERMRREKAHEERWARVRMEADAQQAAVEAVHQQYIQPHTDSPLLERPRLKSMTSLGNLRSASASANALAQQSQVSPKPGKGFRGFVERMGLVGSSASNTPVSSYPGTPLTGSSPGPLSVYIPGSASASTYAFPLSPTPEVVESTPTTAWSPSHSPTTSLTAGNPISGGAHGPGLGSVTLGMRGAKGPKRKLIISGVGLEDVKGYEAVKTWCEKFGEIKEMTRAPNGSLYVDFKKASVAETVCRLQAQVNIRGVGSVTISWYTKKKPT